MPGDHAIGNAVADQARSDARPEQRRSRGALFAQGVGRHGADTRLPHYVCGAGRISLCHQRGQSGQYLRARAARQHGIGDCHRTARRSHVPGQGNRPAHVSFRATRSCGYGGPIGVRMSATAESSAASDKQSARAERSAAARERKPSKNIGEAARNPEKGFDIGYFGDPHFTGWGGGVPIWLRGEVVGAIAVSGLPRARIGSSVQ